MYVSRPPGLKARVPRSPLDLDRDYHAGSYKSTILLRRCLDAPGFRAIVAHIISQTATYPLRRVATSETTTHEDDGSPRNTE